MGKYEGYEENHIGQHNISPETIAGKTAEERKKTILQQLTLEQAKQIETKRQEIFSTGNAQLKEVLQA